MRWMPTSRAARFIAIISSRHIKGNNKPLQAWALGTKKEVKLVGRGFSRDVCKEMVGWGGLKNAETEKESMQTTFQARRGVVQLA